MSCFKSGQGKNSNISISPRRTKTVLENTFSYEFGLTEFYVLFWIGASACLELIKPQKGHRCRAEPLAVSFCQILRKSVVSLSMPRARIGIFSIKTYGTHTKCKLLGILKTSCIFRVSKWKTLSNITEWTSIFFSFVFIDHIQNSKSRKWMLKATNTEPNFSTNSNPASCWKDFPLKQSLASGKPRHSRNFHS